MVTYTHKLFSIFTSSLGKTPTPGFPGGSDSTESTRNAENWASMLFLSWEDPLGKRMAIHSSTLAWRIPWTEEPGGLQSMGSQTA